MEKKILTEVNRIREMMGLQLLNEQTGEIFFKALRNAFEKGGDSELNSVLRASERSAESQGQRALSNRIRNFRETNRGNQSKQKFERFMNDIRNAGFSDDVLKSIFEELPTSYISGLLTPIQVAEQTLRLVERNSPEEFNYLKNIVSNINSTQEGEIVLQQLSSLYKISETETKELLKLVNGKNVSQGLTSKTTFITGIKPNLSDTEKAKEIITLLGDSADTIENDIRFLRNENSVKEYIQKLKTKVKENTGQDITDDVAEEIIRQKRGYNQDIDTWVLNIKSERLNPNEKPQSIGDRFAKGEITADEYIDKTLDLIQAGTDDPFYQAFPSEMGKIKNFVKNPNNRKLIKEKFSQKLGEKDTNIEEALETYIKAACETNPSKCNKGWQETYQLTIGAYRRICTKQKQDAIAGGAGALSLSRYFGTGVGCIFFSSIYNSWAVWFVLLVTMQVKNDDSFARRFITWLYPNWDPIFDGIFGNNCLTQEDAQSFLTDKYKEAKGYDKLKTNNSDGTTTDWEPIEGVNYEYISGEDTGCDGEQLLVVGPIKPPKTEPDVYEVWKNVVNDQTTFELKVPRMSLGEKIKNSKENFKKYVDKTEEKIEKKADELIDVTKEKAQEVQKQISPLKPNNSGGGLGTGQGPGF